MAIPDTGADTTVVGRKTLHDLDIKVVDSAAGAPLLRAANGTPIQSVDQFMAELSYGGRSTYTSITVCNDLEEMLISRTDCVALGILPDGFPNPSQDPGKEPSDYIQRCNQRFLLDKAVTEETPPDQGTTERQPIQKREVEEE